MRVRLAALAASVAAVGGGLAWWVHPGLGIAVAGFLAAVGVLLWGEQS